MPCWLWCVGALALGVLGIPLGMVGVAWLMGPPVTVLYGAYHEPREIEDYE